MGIWNRSIMFRAFLVVLAAASVSAFVAPGVQSSVSVRGSAVTMGAKKSGKVNPALFSNGIDPKKISALNARKKAAAQEKLDDAKGLPKWNLFRVLPKQTAGNTRGIDGSLRFPKPWGKHWGSQGLTDDGEEGV